MAGWQMEGRGRFGRQALKMSCIIAASVILGSCGSSVTRHTETNPQVYKLGDEVPEGGGVRKTGSRYKIKGRWYQPQQTAHASQVGVASWYGEYFHGRKTANGEWYDMERLSAAHPTMPLPSYVRVTNLENDKSIVVRVNDRGPYASERIIDMSHAAADELGFVRAGTTRVRVKYIGDAPLEGDVGDMQYVDSGSRGRRPYITASTKATKTAVAAPLPQRKTAGIVPALAPATTSGGSKSSPLANQLLSTGPLVGLSPRKVSAIPVKILPRKTRPMATLSTKPLNPAPLNYQAGQSSDEIMGFYVQAASFRKLDSARSLRNKLALHKEFAHLGVFDILPVDIGDNTFYRVRLGPFPDRANAMVLRNQITGAGIADARVFAK